MKKLGLFIFLFSILVPSVVMAQGINLNIPLAGQGQIATPVKVILILTFMTFVPAMIISATSFTRIIVVFSFLRQAMGLQSAPPNQVLVGLAIFMTMAIMSPVFNEAYETGVKPYLDGKAEEQVALQNSIEPIRKFMFAQTRASDLNLMLEIARTKDVKSYDDLPTAVLLPAFVLSELKTSFEIGFMIYIPFVIVDMVVSITLLAMGMMMLPPVVISMPFKLLLFVVVDGWDLIVASLVKSFKS